MIMTKLSQVQPGQFLFIITSVRTNASPLIKQVENEMLLSPDFDGLVFFRRLFYGFGFCFNQILSHILEFTMAYISFVLIISGKVDSVAYNHVILERD
jgi:hypothetical protein